MVPIDNNTMACCFSLEKMCYTTKCNESRIGPGDGRCRIGPRDGRCRGGPSEERCRGGPRDERCKGGTRDGDRKSTRLNSSHSAKSRMPSSA